MYKNLHVNNFKCIKERKNKFIDIINKYIFYTGVNNFKRFLKALTESSAVRAVTDFPSSNANGPSASRKTWRS